MQRFIDLFSKFFVGGLFIFSGLIKLNDPVGTEIKLEEYFEVFASDFGSFFHLFMPWALEIGFILIVLEVVLGVAILINWRMSLTTVVLVGLLTFFTFLTFYSAYFNKVTDCGCFGDAIKLTPWESFWKDIVLMIFSLHLFWHRRRFTDILRTREGYAVIVVALVIAVYLGVYAIRHLPFIDFRAYRVGNHIPSQMLPPEQPVIEYLFSRNGEEIASKDFITDTTYTYVSSRILNEDRIKPTITDYAVSSPEGEDKTAYTFEGNRLMIVMYDVQKANPAKMAEIRALTRALDGQVDCFILTSSGYEQAEAFRHEYQLAIPFYLADATVLKTIIRANPGICLWKGGTVLANWHYNDTPEAAEVLRLIR